MMNLSSIEKIIARRLVDLAIRKTSISYSELSKALAKDSGIKINAHFGLSKPLGNIAILCNELRLPLLSVLMEYKNNPSKTAEGFYSIACELKLEYKSMKPNEVRNKELELTQTCTDWWRLLDFLDGKVSSTAPKKSPTIVNESILYDEEQESLDTNTKLSCCAYFLSKFDMQAVEVLGFSTRDEAMISMSKTLGKENNYLKRRRDEFDVLTGSHRKGQRNRPPVSDVLRIHQELKDFSFQELADRVQQILAVPNAIYPDDLPDDSIEYREGKKKMIAVNVHERDPRARRVCINHYGSKCFICDFDFGKVYSAECEGMIHVHHLKMVSESDGEYIVDPIKDLCPVCPNCHMVIHSKKKGIYTVEEVKQMLLE